MKPQIKWKPFVLTFSFREWLSVNHHSGNWSMKIFQSLYCWHWISNFHLDKRFFLKVHYIEFIWEYFGKRHFSFANLIFWMPSFLDHRCLKMNFYYNIALNLLQCVKSVQIRSFFWSVFSRIRTEYGEILRVSPYSFRIHKNTDQKKLRIWTLFTQFFLSHTHILHTVLEDRISAMMTL